jgi:hypothetical protein
MAIRLLPFLLVALVAAPLRAQGPLCLFFGSISPAASLPAAGQVEGGIDRCELLPGGSDWSLSNSAPTTGPGIAPQRIGFSTVQHQLGFQIASKALVSLRFLLGGTEQHATGWFTVGPHLAPWWQWSGDFDAVEIAGAHVLTLAWIDDLIGDPEPELDDPPLDHLLEDFNLQRWGDPMPLIEDLAVVPEPATMTLVGTGLLGIAGAARRRRRREQLD